MCIRDRYEREQMANKVLRFYDRLPEEMDRPFTDDFFWEKPGKEMEAVLENPEPVSYTHLEVTTATTPPGRTRSRDFAIK